MSTDDNPADLGELVSDFLQKYQHEQFPHAKKVLEPVKFPLALTLALMGALCQAGDSHAAPTLTGKFVYGGPKIGEAFTPGHKRLKSCGKAKELVGSYQRLDVTVGEVVVVNEIRWNRIPWKDGIAAKHPTDPHLSILITKDFAWLLLEDAHAQCADTVRYVAPKTGTP